MAELGKKGNKVGTLELSDTSIESDFIGVTKIMNEDMPHDKDRRVKEVQRDMEILRKSWENMVEQDPYGNIKD